MRLWLVHPEGMCQQHLLGEHVECHMFVGTILKGISVQGYIDRGLLDVSWLRVRHDALAAEMLKRGLRHKSPLREFAYTGDPGRIDSAVAQAELVRRCKKCAHNFAELSRYFSTT